MKKIILLLLFLGSFCYGQLTEECFEGSWSPVPAGSGSAADWLVLDNGIGMNYTWVQQVNSDTTPSSEGIAGTHSAYLQRENVDPGLAADYLVTPQFTLQPGAELNFLSRLTVADVQGSIYKVMILPSSQLANAVNPASYVVIEDWLENEINPNQFVYEQKTVTFPTEYDGTTVRLAFVMEGDFYDRWLIDCVSVTQPCPEVSALATGAVDFDSAEITWTNPEGGATSWEIEIVPENQATTGTGIPYNGSLPYIATQISAGAALVPGEGYRVYVRAVCNDGGKSDWVGPVSFETIGLGETCAGPIEITTLPFLDTDNTINFANNYNDSGAGCNSPAWDNNMTGNDVVYRFTPDFSGPVNFLMTDNDTYSGMYIVNECADIGFSCLGGGVTGVVGNDISVENFEVVSGEDYYIIISTAYYLYPTTNYTLIIQRVFCEQPEGLPVTNVGMTSADLNWTTAGATSWELYVQDLGGGIPSGGGVATTDNTDYTVTHKANGTPLVAQSSYEYWVRADCGDDTFSAWAGPYRFNTLICEASAQCNYTFNMWSGNFGPWEQQSMNVEQNGIVVAVLTGPAEWAAGVISQEVALCDGFPFNLTWNASGNAGANVGISVENGFDQVLYTKNPGQAAPGQILYQSDELDCYTPLCMPPTGLSVDNITTTTADLEWEGPATGTWEYYIVEAGQPAPTAATSGTPTTTNPTAGVAIEIATEYEYYVRQVCIGATTPTSVWASPFAFSSSVCAETDKCEYRFVLKSNSWGGYAGGTITISQNEVTVAILGPQFTTGESMEVPVMICDDQPLEIYWSGFGSNPGQMGLEVFNSFDQPIYTLPFHSSNSIAVGSLIYQTINDCDIPLCMIPEELTAENPTLTTIDLGWEGPATGTWEYYIVEAGGAAPSETTSGTPTTTNPVIGAGPLEEATEYEYYVRMICQGTEPYSEWAGPFAFSSSVCPPEDKCDFIFVLTSGWGSHYEGGSITVSQNDVDVAVLGPQFVSDGYMEVTVPLCNNIPFKLHWDNGGASASQMGLDVINSHWQIIYSLPTDNPGTGVGTYIFEGMVDCENPDCLPPTGLYADNQTTNSVDLGWEGPATGTWEYYIAEAGAPAPSTGTVGTMTSTNPTVGVPLASPFTHYEYYVRSHCEGTSTDTSAWGGPHPFYSEVCDPEDRCPYTFEMTSLSEGGNLGASFTLYQNGIPVGNYPSNIYWGGAEYSEEILLCPDAELKIVWTTGGFQPLEKSLTISSPFEEIFSMEYMEFNPGDTIFTGMLSCDPPSCLKPVNLTVSDIGITQATFGWEESGTATEWAVWVLPINSAEPAADTPPTFTTTQNPVIYGDNAGEILLPGTAYEFYVMAMCGGDDGSSIVSVPGTFATVLTNDECAGAINVPVSPDIDCIESVYGTLTGSTLSDVDSTCGGFYSQTDVWFKFTATAEDLAIHVSNISNIDYNNALFLSIFSGDCNGGMTELNCGPAGITFYRNYVIGDTYYLRLSGPLAANESIISSFDICISTPEPVIRVSDDEFTNEELVTQILANTGCVNISNVTSFTGKNLGLENSNGIGYFNRNGSDFEFEEGIVLATGDIRKAPGRADQYNTGIPYNTDWPGVDDDLVEILDIYSETMHSPSVLEFDFQPVADSIKLRFIYASDEYTWCNNLQADKFAVILSGPGIPEPINIAVVPGTDMPISPLTVRGNRQYENGYCDGINQPYFDEYNDENYGWTLDEDINYVGQTVPIIASSPVIPGQTYHLKIAVADYYHGGYCTAVFFEGGSLNIGEIDLGPDYVRANDTALCTGETVTLTPNLSEDEYTFEWLANNEVVDGETGPSLTVNENDFDFAAGPVTFAVKALHIETNCLREDTVLVEYINMTVETPLDLTACIDLNGNATFDIESNTAVLLAGVDDEDQAGYTVKYYASEEDRENDIDDLSSPYIIEDAVEGEARVIYVGVANAEGCTAVSQFTITPVNASAQINLTPSLTLCEGSVGTITAEILPVGTEVSFSWTKDGAPFAGTGAQIEITEAGNYEVTINQNGCFRSAATTVTTVPLPVVEEKPDVSSCSGYALPALDDDNDYFTGPGGSGTLLVEGDMISATQTIYIHTQSDTEPFCTNESSFVVTITPAPEFNLGGPYVYCDFADAIVSVSPENFNLADASFAWKVNGAASAETGSSIQATAFGTYEATVTINGCAATHSVEVTENIAVIALTIIDECIDDVYTLTAVDVDGSFEPLDATYAWTGPGGFTASTQAITPQATGTYIVAIATPENCTGTDTFEVTDTLCFIQRGISPNNDGDNDSFDLTLLDVTKISIFNRYGMEVYSRKNYTNEWEGQSGNGDELPSGTYFYSIERRNGEQITGWIYINREI